MAALINSKILAGAVCVLAVACGGSDPEPQSQFQGGAQMGQPGQPAPGQPVQGQPAQQPPPGQPAAPPPGQPGAPPPGQPGAPPPAGVPGFPAPASGAPCQPLDPSAGAAIQPILNQLANTEAPGAKPVGAASVAMCQQGQQFETAVQLQPGKCYTVIAVGLPPVAEMNVQLIATTPIPGMSPVLAEDQTTGPQGVLGKSPNCFRWPLPLPGGAKAIATTAGGQGMAAFQVYEK
jgi:hypothetical protein